MAVKDKAFIQRFLHSFNLKTSANFFLLFLIIITQISCHSSNIGVLNPKGLIAFEERKLFFDTLALMLIVVLPVIIMSFTFVYHYQASHRVKDYKPNWSHSYFLECLWWGIPCVIIFILGMLTWEKTHELDPYKKIAGHHDAYLIHVIALPWKWLFIYPKEHIATLNYLVIPEGEQVEYWLTADNVPMSAFFIPQLGSQIFAMAGMRTRLHLLANQEGIYDGMNTQYNGPGFSDMRFKVEVLSPKKMSAWIKEASQSKLILNAKSYQALTKPMIAAAPMIFSHADENIFNEVLHLYMHTYGNVHPRISFGYKETEHD